MSDTLSQLITKVQAILGDDGTIFTTATCTAALRQALADYSRAAPQHLAVTITGVNDQYEYELSDEDPEAEKILDVLQQGDNQDELDISLTYDDYIEDERVFFRLRAPITTSDTLIVRYTKPQTISGLDSEVESTIATRHDQVLVDGGAFHSLMIRAVSRVETINLSKDQSDNYREITSHFRNAFNAGLRSVAQSRRAPVSEPDTRAWNDHYHSWGQ